VSASVLASPAAACTNSISSSKMTTRISGICSEKGSNQPADDSHQDNNSGKNDNDKNTSQPTMMTIPPLSTTIMTGMATASMTAGSKD